VSTQEPEDGLQRLDPDRAAGERTPAASPGQGARTAPGRARSPFAFDPRRLQWVAGALALVLVVGFSLYRFTAHGVGTAGIPAGKPARLFSAPLAASRTSNPSGTSSSPSI